MTFFDTPILTPLGDGEWRLFAPLGYVTRSGETIIVPAGFITDLASIPRVFRLLIPVNGRHRAAAIIHDYLFVIQDRPRSEVDRVFLEAMEDCDVGAVQRYAMYSAVRIGGWLPWLKNKRSIESDRHAHMINNGLA